MTVLLLIGQNSNIINHFLYRFAGVRVSKTPVCRIIHISRINNQARLFQGTPISTHGTATQSRFELWCRNVTGLFVQTIITIMELISYRAKPNAYYLYILLLIAYSHISCNLCAFCKWSLFLLSFISIDIPFCGAFDRAVDVEVICLSLYFFVSRLWTVELYHIDQMYVYSCFVSKSDA